MTDVAGVPDGGRTWRLPFRSRVLRIAFLALVPVCAAGFVALPPDSSPGPVSWGVVAAFTLAWLALAWRMPRTSVTLTADALMIRNVYSTKRIPLSAVRGVTIIRTGLRVIEAGSPAPTGRHVGGPSHPVGAAPVGGAYWTGRRIEADEIAEAIAAAAGLPLPAPRKEKLSRPTAWFVLAAGVVCAAAGLLLGPLRGAGTGASHALGFAAVVLWPSGTMLLLIAVPAILDYLRTPSPRNGSPRSSGTS